MTNGRDYLRAFVDRVKSLKPDSAIEFDDALLCEIPCYQHNGVTFTPPDQILENIVGSAYEFSYHRNYTRQTTTFYRMPEPLSDESGERTYLSPDRRDRKSP